MANDLLCFEMWWPLIEGNAALMHFNLHATFRAFRMHLHRSAGLECSAFNAPTLCLSLCWTSDSEIQSSSASERFSCTFGQPIKVCVRFGDFYIPSSKKNCFDIINSLWFSDLKWNRNGSSGRRESDRPISCSTLQSLHCSALYAGAANSSLLYVNWKNFLNGQKSLKKRALFYREVTPE